MAEVVVVADGFDVPEMDTVAIVAGDAPTA